MKNMDHNARITILAGAALLVFILSLFVGRYPLTPWDLQNDEMAFRIFRDIRLPRVIIAALLGASLAVAGATLQSTFRNPIVGPSILGVSQGAAFGAALAILYLSGYPLLIEVSSTLFGVIALVLSYGFSRFVRYGDNVLRLILAGLAVSALFSGGVGIMKSLADPLNQLPELTFWLLGGLSGVTWVDLYYVSPFVFLGILVLLLVRWRLNLLVLDDDVIQSLGVDPVILRVIAVSSSVAVIAAVTSVAGVINWMGLIAPHMARKLFGVNNKQIIPASILLGAVLMIIFDDISRTLSSGEIPLGVSMSLLGAPLFILLLSRGESQ